MVEDQNPEQSTGPEDEELDHQSTGPDNNVQTPESQEHVDQPQKDQDVGRTQESQVQRKLQTTMSGKEQPYVVPTTHTSPATIKHSFSTIAIIIQYVIVDSSSKTSDTSFSQEN